MKETSILIKSSQDGILCTPVAGQSFTFADKDGIYYGIGYLQFLHNNGFTITVAPRHCQVLTCNRQASIILCNDVSNPCWDIYLAILLLALAANARSFRDMIGSQQLWTTWRLTLQILPIGAILEDNNSILNTTVSSLLGAEIASGGPLFFHGGNGKSKGSAWVIWVAGSTFWVLEEAIRINNANIFHPRESCYLRTSDWTDEGTWRGIPTCDVPSLQ
jgi:hypothetical protein